MKKSIYVMIVLFILSFSFLSEANGYSPRPRKSSSGKYVGGSGGSSHKGAKYKNASTNDHYIKHK